MNTPAWMDNLRDEEERSMEKKEKPLSKMTAKELREVALGLPGIEGVHAMKKEELLAAIRAAKGITEEEPKERKQMAPKKEKVVLSKAEMKQKIKEMRLKREEASQQTDLKMAVVWRKRIKRLKKMTRRGP
jgi:cell division protein FtsX